MGLALTRSLLLSLLFSLALFLKHKYSFPHPHNLHIQTTMSIKASKDKYKAQLVWTLKQMHHFNGIPRKKETEERRSSDRLPPSMVPCFYFHNMFFNLAEQYNMSTEKA